MAALPPAPRRLLASLAGAVLLLALPAAAETPRAELGKRLRRFETAWQEADAATRARAVAPMSAAVRGFFSLDLVTAARELDRAWFAVRAAAPPDAAERRTIAFAASAAPLLADAAEETITVSVAPFYGADADGQGGQDATPAADAATLHLAVVDAAGTTLAERAFPWPAPAEPVAWRAGPLPEGDHALVAERVDGERRIPFARIGISRATGLAARLAALAAAREGMAGRGSPTARTTVTLLAGILEALAADRGQETDYPALRLLETAEALAADPGPERIAGAAPGGDLWVALSDGRVEVPVRLRVPAGAAGPLPVLFLHHGAGGSENMFFDACGAGRAVGLGVERGWLVVAPRQGLFGLPLDVATMLDILAESFPIDRRRVFLVGHSMGAGQVARQVGLAPDAVAAAVALGGGAGAPGGEAAARVPWFVGAGEQDFGRRGAEGLAARLAAAGTRVERHLYPDVEHMVVVQAALDDVFAFLDGVAAAPPRAPAPAP
ncbi:MAG: hypothetical protein ACKO3G_10205 [Planctomycetaceae bacterium]